jgi:hypothetical protein
MYAIYGKCGNAKAIFAIPFARSRIIELSYTVVKLLSAPDSKSAFFTRVCRCIVRLLYYRYCIPTVYTYCTMKKLNVKECVQFIRGKKTIMFADNDLLFSSITRRIQRSYLILTACTVYVQYTTHSSMTFLSFPNMALTPTRVTCST